MRRAGLPNVPEYTRWSKCMSWNWEASTEQIGGRSGKLADPLSVHSQNYCCFKGIALEFILPAPVAFAGTPFHFIFNAPDSTLEPAVVHGMELILAGYGSAERREGGRLAPESIRLSSRSIQ